MSEEPSRPPSAPKNAWWITSQNDNQEGLPDSFPRYRCRAGLALVGYLLIQLLILMCATWYQTELVRIGREMRITPIDTQMASLVVTALFAAVGTLIATIWAAWVLIGNARLLKSVCREWG